MVKRLKCCNNVENVCVILYQHFNRFTISIFKTFGVLLWIFQEHTHNYPYAYLQCRSLVLGHLPLKIQVNNLPHPPSLQAMLSLMIKRTFIQEKLFTYICQHCVRGGRGDYAQIVLNYSLVFFWTVFTSVPNTYDLHCSLLAAPAKLLFLPVLRCYIVGNTNLQLSDLTWHFTCKYYSFWLPRLDSSPVFSRLCRSCLRLRR